MQAILVLYLDFDGVLHPEHARMGPTGPYVHSLPGHALFEHAQLRADLLEPYPNLQMVLSTTWTQPSFQRARKRLPSPLTARCVGGTFHSNMDRQQWRTLSRGAQVLPDDCRRQPAAWVAIDDNDEGWGQNLSSNVVITDPIQGITEPALRAQLVERLRRFA